MARGLTRSVYVDDNGNGYVRMTDADHALDEARGWPGTAALPVIAWFPQRAKPRMVFGVSPTSGRRGHTVVASITAPLWTGAAAEFVIESSDSDAAAPRTDTLTVTRRRGESIPL